MKAPSKIPLFSVIFMMLMMTGCSVIQYRSSGLIPVYFSPKSHPAKEFEVELKKQFFLFGFIPQSNVVWVDEVIKKKGFDKLSKLSIYERTSWSDLGWSLLSLGLYTPRTITLSGKALISTQGELEAEEGE